MDHRVLVVFVSLWSSVAPDGDDVRLVGGASHCHGILEKKQEEAWKPVDDESSAWNLTSAAAVCRKLDCGSVVSFLRTATQDGPLDILNHDFLHVVNLHSSGSTGLEISCLDSVRLVNGTSLCSGRLEVKSNQSWSSVCEADFDQQDAEVVCRELGCGPPSVLQGALYGEVEAPTWTKEFQCGGHESALLDCRSSGSTRNTCSPGKAVGLTCSETVDLRLVGGVSRCSGMLEVKQDNWKPVDHRYWNLRLAGGVCGQLDCGSAVSVRRRTKSSHGHVWKTEPDCEASALTKCLRRNVLSSDVVEITCSDSVRLVNGTSPCSGRLEVKSDQSWSSVCEADFDQQDAEVVCRELGCGAPSVLQGALYGEVEAPTWTKEFQCGGHESALLDCRSSGSTRNTCSPGKAVGLTCSDPDDVRLAGGANRCTGRLELKHGGVWKAVDHFDSHWHLKATPVICQRLDCGSFISAAKKRESSPRPVWWIDSRCVQSESTLHQCVTTNHEFSEYSLEITCSDSVRLVDRSQCSGRLEVKSNQSWTLVCEDEFDQQDGGVLCREFGCGAPVWTQCEGLQDCGTSSSTTDTCSPGKAVELTCSAPDNIRLVGAASRCGGELEMKNHGEWRPVADLDDGWDEKSAAAVCRLMDCGSAVSTQITEASDDRPVWWISPSCVQSAPALSECLLLTNIDETYLGLHVICSGKSSLVALFGSSVVPEVCELTSSSSSSSICNLEPVIGCIHEVPPDLLVQPNISSSTSTEGVSNDKQQGLQVLLGSDFTITCSVEPQYAGGSFQLIFTTANAMQNYTQPAVNHSAHFLFSAASHAHQGEYRCVYHVYVFSHNFSSESRTLGVTVSAYLMELIIRLVVLLTLLITLLVTVLCVHSKVSRIQKPRGLRSFEHEQRSMYLSKC